ncbi:hypothetical protein FA15DRAFT_708238 [Coprinopsis marcescibilis]|uniref:Fungal-type protein kinase domain-containing protein n=1 Tax=Coprinopsis marcescibilis TaxID=230819 RepID=A0A5C3KWE9_COPMA|nr:hypothetical protein FA15DRAFT_708238 [Coprinopsis marcescibilis]
MDIGHYIKVNVEKLVASIKVAEHPLDLPEHQRSWEKTFTSMASNDAIKQYLQTTTRFDSALAVLENPEAEVAAIRDAILSLLEDVLDYFPKKPLGTIRQNQPFVYAGTSDEIIITRDGPQFQEDRALAESGIRMPWLPKLLTVVCIEHKERSPSPENAMRRMAPFVVPLELSDWFTSTATEFGTLTKHRALETTQVSSSGSHPEDVGFDSHITWKNITNVQRRILRQVGLLKNPVFKGLGSYAVGRGTTGWLVVSKSGQKLFVKDSWQNMTYHSSPIPEEWLLETVIEKKVVGVVQMVQGSGQIYKTKFCAFGDKMDRGFFENKYAPNLNLAKSRIVMEFYGSPTNEFKTARQFLYAFHDTFNGHRSLLLDGGILHCDISVGNILLGRPNAKVDWRGVC